MPFLVFGMSIAEPSAAFRAMYGRRIIAWLVVTRNTLGVLPVFLHWCTLDVKRPDLFDVIARKFDGPLLTQQRIVTVSPSTYLKSLINLSLWRMTFCLTHSPPRFGERSSGYASGESGTSWWGGLGFELST
jgi:hypothetical protein